MSKQTTLADLDQMKKLAITEAKKLKMHAKNYELEKLDVEAFNPEYPATCIYGLMTGYCFSDRAHELIRKCAPKMYEMKGKDIEAVQLNGSPQQLNLDQRRAAHYSPIETLIFNEWGGKHLGEKLIAFLKDETQTLEL